MSTGGFYKRNDADLLFGPNFVSHPEFELLRELKDEYDYPVDGWYWFDDEDAAYDFFGVKKFVPPTSSREEVS